VSRPHPVAGRIVLMLLGGGLSTAAGCRGEGERAMSYGIGRPATAEEVAAWDIDVNPAGEGLPAGSGTAVEGAKVFAAKCASCHGAKGEGLSAAPTLVGREPREGFPFGRSLRFTRTVGNYWPYATTLYDYINRAMPTTEPGSLTADEIYSAVAWILARSEIIDSAMVVDAASLPRIRMPARDRFVPDDRSGGPEFR